MQAMREVLGEPAPKNHRGAQDQGGHKSSQAEDFVEDPDVETASLPAAIRMTRLAESFRCLEDKPGVRPWDAAKLADWVRSRDSDATYAQAQAAAFVLEVANMSAVWDGVPSFKVRDAALAWSQDDRAAFAAWTQNPWYL